MLAKKCILMLLTILFLVGSHVTLEAAEEPGATGFSMLVGVNALLEKVEATFAHLVNLVWEAVSESEAEEAPSAAPKPDPGPENEFGGGVIPIG